MPQWVFRYLTTTESPFVEIPENQRRMLRVYNTLFSAPPQTETLVAVQIIQPVFGDGILTAVRESAMYSLGKAGNLFLKGRVENGYITCVIQVAGSGVQARIGGVFHPESLVSPKVPSAGMLVSQEIDTTNRLISKVVHGSLFRATTQEYLVDPESEGAPSVGDFSSYYGFFGDVQSPVGYFCTSYPFFRSLGPSGIDHDYAYEPYLTSADAYASYHHFSEVSTTIGRPIQNSFFFVGMSGSSGKVFIVRPRKPNSGDPLEPILPLYFRVRYWLPIQSLVKCNSPKRSPRVSNYKFQHLTNKTYRIKGRNYSLSSFMDTSERMSSIHMSQDLTFYMCTDSTDDVASLSDIVGWESISSIDQAYNNLVIGV